MKHNLTPEMISSFPKGYDIEMENEVNDVFNKLYIKLNELECYIPSLTNFMNTAFMKGFEEGWFAGYKEGQIKGEENETK